MTLPENVSDALEETLDDWEERYLKSYEDSVKGTRSKTLCLGSLNAGLRTHIGEFNPFHGRLITLKNQLLKKKGCPEWFPPGLFDCDVEIKGYRTEQEEEKQAMRDFEEQMSKSIREQA